MNKEILKLAVPNIISNISVPLLSTVDTALMGHLSAVHLAAVGVSSMLFNFIYWNFGFLRMGTTGMTAQAYGAEDHMEMAAVLTRGLALSLLLALIIYLCRMPLFQAGAYLLQIGEDTMPLVLEYYLIRILDVPASLALFAMMGWYFGMQNSYIPLVITIVVNVVNMTLSYYWVVGLDWGITGVAWGTVVAQYLGLGLACGIHFVKFRSYFKEIKLSILKEVTALVGYLRINSDIFIRTVCLTFAFGFFYSMSSEAGTMALAMNVVLQQFLNWMSYAVDGFAHASESLVGKYKGRKDGGMTHLAIRYSFYWGIGFSLLFSMIYAFFGNEILSIFTSGQDLINHIQPYLFWVVLMPFFASWSYIWDGIYIGLTASRAMRDAMVIALVIYLITYYIGLRYVEVIHNLWFSLGVFLVSRALIQWWFYKKMNLGFSST